MSSNTIRTKLMLAGLLWALAGSVHAVRIVSVTTCESVMGEEWIPVNIRESFANTIPEVHAVVNMEEAKANSVVKGAWISIDAISVPNYEIDSAEVQLYKNGPAVAHFSMNRPDKGWPLGNYRIDIYIDGKLTAAKTFSITGGASAQPALPAAPVQNQQQEIPQKTMPPPVQPSQGAYGFSGTYVSNNQGVVLSLVLNHSPSGELKGSLSSNTGVQYTLEGMVENDVGYGACYNEEGGVFFESRVTGDMLSFALIEPDANNMPDYNRVRELNFTRQSAPVQERPAMGGRITPTTETSPTMLGGTSQGGKIFRHPIGFSFRYPEQWTIVMQDGYLQLTPPNPGQMPDGPRELYYLMGEKIEPGEFSRPDDPIVIQYLDQQVKSVVPSLQYSGQAQPVQLNKGMGTLLEWKGGAGQNEPAVARCFVCVLEGHSIALLAIGYQQDVLSRDSDMRGMFTSFTFGQGQLDSTLVGTWELVSTMAITNQSVWETDWSRAQAVSESSSMLTFQPDGRWQRRDQSHTLIGSSGIWLEDKSDDTSQGTWNAGDGLLYMVWEDNSEQEYQYRLEQNGQSVRLRLVTGNKGQIWERR